MYYSRCLIISSSVYFSSIDEEGIFSSHFCDELSHLPIGAVSFRAHAKNDNDCVARIEP